MSGASPALCGPAQACAMVGRMWHEEYDPYDGLQEVVWSGGCIEGKGVGCFDRCSCLWKWTKRRRKRECYEDGSEV